MTSLPGSLAAQSTKADREVSFWEALDAAIVNVDVVVGDAQGDPVVGLTPADFEIFEDGEVVEISAFLAVEGGRPAGNREIDGLSPRVPPLTLADDLRLNLIVFVDNPEGSQAIRNRLLPPLEEFLRTRLRAEDRAMIVGYNGLVSVHEQLTDDVDDLLAALETAVLAAGGSETAVDPSNPDSSSVSIRQFVNSLAAIRGRKAILYIGARSAAVPELDGFRTIGELTDHARSQRVSVYAIDGDEDPAADPDDPRSLLNRLRRDFDFYYSLAYEPSRRNGGEVHGIAVQLSDSTLLVRHRERVRAPTVAERMGDRARSALLLETHENPMGIGVEFGEGTKLGNGRFEVPVIVKIPMSQVVLRPDEKHHEGSLAIYVTERDERGRTSPVQHFSIPIRIDNDKLLALLAQTGGYSLTLELGPGEHTVAIAVRDELGHVASTISAPCTPGGPVMGTN